MLLKQHGCSVRQHNFAKKKISYSQHILITLDSDSEVSKFYVTLPDNKMLGSGRSIIEEFILRDSFSTGLQHMFNALGSILETLIDIVPSDYKFVSFHFHTQHCEKELMADWPKNLPRKGVSRCWRSGGLCGSVSFSSPFFSRGTLWSGVFFFSFYFFSF